MNVTLNYLLLAVQAAALTSVTVVEIARRRNVVALLLFTVLAVVVVLQAWFMLLDLQGGEPARFFANAITWDGFSLANSTMTLAILITLAVYAAGRHRRVTPGPLKAKGLPQTSFSYLVVLVVVLTATAALVRLLGGPRNVLFALGVMKAGQVFLFTGVLLGKMPLLYKLAYRRSRTFADWGLFVGSIFVVMLNSRGNAIYAIAQVMILYHYSIRRVSPKAIAVFAAIGLAIIMGYGSVRTYVSVHGQYSAPGLANYLVHSRHLYEMYHHQVGVFSGLAGILTQYQQAGIRYDFGLSNLMLFTHLLPNVVRKAAVGGVDQWIAALYPYRGSVVPGGYEAAFANFGFVGIFVLSVLLGALPAWFHNRLASSEGDRLLFGVLSIYVLSLVMGQLWLALVFAIPDMALVLVYRSILGLTAGRPAAPVVSVGSMAYVSR